MDKFIVTGGKRAFGEPESFRLQERCPAYHRRALLAEKGKTHLTNIPILADIHTMNGVLAGLGADIRYDPAAGSMSIDATI